ncbi:DUF4328 domain-containing protein [Litoribrevibacter euphylliae]|uniref:DUF4328 domain-containing protein n=1 Tax=Litoribrevibacter euphylliae TaxID=1834034 RepID=A0ABV7H8J3_9GAMM
MPNKESNYRDASSLTSWVRYSLYAQIVVALIMIGSNYLEYQLLSDYQNGVYTSQEQAVADGEASDQRQQMVAYLYFAVFIISGFLILRWIHRSNYNARQLGAKDMKFTPGWSIGYYFIPILTLWKPYQAMEEIWKASHNPNDWQSEEASSILGLWWLLWIISNILGHIVFRMSSSANELSELMNINLMSQALEVLTIPLVLVFLAIVNTVYAAQRSAYQNADQPIPQPAVAAAE